jgi:hypothetical protein
VKKAGRLWILIVLGAVLMIVAWIVPSLPPSEESKGSPVRAASPSRVVPHPEGRMMALLAAKLDAARATSAAGRDPWRFVDPPPSRPSPAEPAALAEAPRPVAAPLPSPDAKPPEIPLEYLGHFGPSHKKIAVLSDGKRIYNALEGDVVGGRFIVARIGYESVEIQFLGFPGRPARRLGVRSR